MQELAKRVLVFLNDASNVSLEQFELARLNEAQNVRKECRALLDRMIDLYAQAELARIVRENRKVLVHGEQLCLPMEGGQ